MNIKQIFLTATILACTLVFGAANDTILTFSTKGPDTYGDGTTVLDGECYALVWVKDGTTFSGLAADGSPLADTTKVVAVAPLAKGGRCPETVFEIDADYATTFAGGGFALYLLDTRISTTELAKSVNGVPASVNAAGEASPSTSASASPLTTTANAVALAEVGVYTKIDEPVISAMEMRGAKIELIVEGMCPAAEYMVVQGAAPSEVKAKMNTTIVGNRLIVDKPEGGAMFFKVLGTRRFK